MCIKDRKRLKLRCLALLGLCLYLFDTGSDSWVGARLIQNCHTRFGAGVLCLVYVLPGFFIVTNYMLGEKEDDTFIYELLVVFFGFVFWIPFSIFLLMVNLVTLNDEWLAKAKM